MENLTLYVNKINTTNKVSKFLNLRQITFIHWNEFDYLQFQIIIRSSHQGCSMEKDVLRNFTKFTAKHLCQSLFLNKFAGLMPATLWKKSLWYKCFPVNFVKFLRTSFLQNTSRRLLLYYQNIYKKMGKSCPSSFT